MSNVREPAIKKSLPSVMLLGGGKDFLWLLIKKELLRSMITNVLSFWVYTDVIIVFFSVLFYPPFLSLFLHFFLSLFSAFLLSFFFSFLSFFISFSKTWKFSRCNSAFSLFCKPKPPMFFLFAFDFNFFYFYFLRHFILDLFTCVVELLTERLWIPKAVVCFSTLLAKKMSTLQLIL